MVIKTEPAGYEKTALSDLQGAWENLKDAVVSNIEFRDSDRIMFHLHEAMSWENVRNLDKMRETLLLIENIVAQTVVPDDVQFWLEEVRGEMENIMSMVMRGEKV